jgi:hypothetical protein
MYSCTHAIAALETRRDKTRLLKQGMMQQLLIGKQHPAQRSGRLMLTEHYCSVIE